MRESVFFEFEFVLLVASSFVVPIGIYIYLLRKKAISRRSILAYSMLLIALSVLDIFLLQSLAESAKLTLSPLDDKLFSSGLSIALYILPVIFAGIAINLVSHILNKHLDEAEQQFKQQPATRPFQFSLQIRRNVSADQHQHPDD